MKQKEPSKEPNLGKETTGEKRSDSKPKEDVLLLHSPTEDGDGVRALRCRPDRVDFAELRPIAEGKPIHNGEIVKLTPREENPLICDVETELCIEEGRCVEARVGPARVSTEKYRANWDDIFGGESHATTDGEKSRLLN